jgi:hypothetical protein
MVSLPKGLLDYLIVQRWLAPEPHVQRMIFVVHLGFTGPLQSHSWACVPLVVLELLMSMQRPD